MFSSAFSSSSSDAEIAASFKTFHTYRPCTFLKNISSNDHMFKFKEKFKTIDKISREQVKHHFKQLKNQGIEIYVKDKNKKTVYIEECQTEEEPKNEVPKKESPKKEEEAKVNKEKSFIVKGGYSDIAKALLKRGWKQIPTMEDPNFPNFDYFYPLKNNDIKYEELKPNQMVAHFLKAKELTRKINLMVNLRYLYFRGIILDNFFPRAYSLSEKNDLEDFLEEFKVARAFAILKKCIEKNGIGVNKEMVMTAYDIIKRREGLYINEKEYLPLIKKAIKKDFSDKDIGQEFCFKTVTDQEWRIIGNEDMDVYEQYLEKLMKLNVLPRTENYKGTYHYYLEKKENKSKGRTEGEKAEDIREKAKLEEDVSDLSKRLAMFAQENLEEKVPPKEEIPEEEKPKQEEKKEESDDDDDVVIGTYEDAPQMKHHPRPLAKPENDDVSDKIFEIRMLYEKLKPHLPQDVIEGTNNLWICKPGGLSRGRGIYCIDQINDLLADIKICGHTIVQKYIENPLIILNRKFDIRQWVLVSDLSPLTLWLFDTPYLRFSAEDYDANNFMNTFSHLTNNSIAKHSAHFKETPIKDNMWFIEEFREYLKEHYGEDYWPEIQEKIAKIVTLSIASTKHKLFDRKNCHEVFGYDFMIDENLNVYLIEINASPDWTYSTHVTEKLVKQCSEDIVKVTVDYAENEKKKPSERKVIDTGLLKRIYCSNDFPKFEPLINKIQRKKLK